MIDDSLADFLQAGLPIHIGTRNAHLEPHGCRVTAVLVQDDREHVIAFVPKVAAPPVLHDLADNGQAALTFARPPDERSCQLKGTFVSAAPASARDRAAVLAQWDRCLARLESVGYPRVASQKWKMWPCVSVKIKVTALFNQTPGPGAGGPLT